MPRRAGCGRPRAAAFRTGQLHDPCRLPAYRERSATMMRSTSSRSMGSRPPRGRATSCTCCRPMRRTTMCGCATTSSCSRTAGRIVRAPLCPSDPVRQAIGGWPPRDLDDDRGTGRRAETVGRCGCRPAKPHGAGKDLACGSWSSACARTRTSRASIRRFGTSSSMPTSLRHRQTPRAHRSEPMIWLGD